jgi:hypothetical protein
MASDPKAHGKWIVRSRRRKALQRRGALQSILFRLDKGEITVSDAYNEVQESDREQRSRLDRFLEVIVG